MTMGFGTDGGRLVKLGLLLVIITTVTVSALAAMNTETVPQTPTKQITVQHGDSLWSIAKTNAPHEDPRKTVWEIRQMNELAQAIIYPGQVLEVPDYNGI